MLGGNWPCHGDRCRPCLAYLTGAAMIEGGIRVNSWRRGSSADFLASRTVAWDSSLSANASKVLSTRALLPIAPRRDSAASDSQQFWRAHFIHLAIATPRLEADAYAGGFVCNGICSLAKFAVGHLIFWKAENCRRQSRVLLSRLCLAKYTAAAFAANSCVAGADEG